MFIKSPLFVRFRPHSDALAGRSLRPVVHGSIAIRLHLSFRGPDELRFDLHFEQMNKFGISFLDMCAQVKWYQTVH